MNTRKCPSCGGEMELSISNKCLICPFCDTHIDVDMQDDGNTGMLDERMFDFLWNLDSLKQYDNVIAVLDSMRYCLNSLKTRESVSKYIRTALLTDEDVASEGINQKRIDKIMPKIAELIEPGERIIVYGDDGILSRGKEFFVITDKRSIFVNRKKRVPSCTVRSVPCVLTRTAAIHAGCSTIRTVLPSPVLVINTGFRARLLH